jgi:AraC-like DNA-binding protein
MPKKTAHQGPAEAMLRVGTAMALPEVLRRLGANPRDVLSEAGFDVGLFDDPDNLITFKARGRLIAHCVARTGCQHFGLLVGQPGGLHSLGLMGLLAKFSPDVGTALNSLVRYFHLHLRGAALILTVDGGAAILNYQIYERGAQANDQVGDGVVAVMFNIMRELCGPDWKPTEVWFAHRKPENIEPFRRFFQVRLRFDAEQNAVIFSSSWLQRPLPEVHPDARRSLQKQIDALEARHGDNFPEQVRTVLRAALASGDARADRVAALFSMNRRTLNRRLNSFGIGYQELVDEIRFGLAQQLLDDTDLAVSEIAMALHYADARSFIRAFRRWSDATPARWRAKQKMLRRTALSPRRSRMPSSAAS